MMVFIVAKCGIKFTIFTILSVWFNGVKYIHVTTTHIQNFFI